MNTINLASQNPYNTYPIGPSWPEPHPPQPPYNNSNEYDLRNNGNIAIDQNYSTLEMYNLGSRSSGHIVGDNLKTTVFNYGTTPGTKSMFLDGGQGYNDVFALELNSKDALQALRDRGYTFAINHRGFTLITNTGQRIDVTDVERIAFPDVSFDITDPSQASGLLNALKDAGIPIRDERYNNYPDYNHIGYYSVSPYTNYSGASQRVSNTNHNYVTFTNSNNSLMNLLS